MTLQFRGCEVGSQQAVYGSWESNPRGQHFIIWFDNTYDYETGESDIERRETEVYPASVGLITPWRDKYDTPIYTGDLLDFDPEVWGGHFEPEEVTMDKVLGQFGLCGCASDIAHHRAIVGRAFKVPKPISYLFDDPDELPF